MTQESDVISAFLDNEPFDPAELGDALAGPAGRELLIDLMVLRSLVQAHDAPVEERAPAARQRDRRRFLAAVAAVALLAFAGGYRVADRSEPSSAPPPATAVIEATSWQDVPAGGNQ